MEIEPITKRRKIMRLNKETFIARLLLLGFENAYEPTHEQFLFNTYLLKKADPKFYVIYKHVFQSSKKFLIQDSPRVVIWDKASREYYNRTNYNRQVNPYSKVFYRHENQSYESALKDILAHYAEAKRRYEKLKV